MEGTYEPKVITHTADDWKLQIQTYFDTIQFVVQTTNQGKWYRNKFDYKDLPNGIKQHFKTIKQLERVFAKSRNFTLKEGVIKVLINNVVDNEIKTKQEIIKLKQVERSVDEKPYNMLVMEVQQLKQSFAQFVFNSQYPTLTNPQDKYDLCAEVQKKQAQQFHDKGQIIELKNKLVFIQQQIQYLKHERLFTEEKVLGLKEKEEAIMVEKEKKSKEKAQLILDNLLDKTTPFIEKFDIEGNVIQYIGINKRTTQFLTSEIIPYKYPYDFYCKIHKSQWSYIAIGVVDRDKQKNQCYSSTSANAICYLGKYGQVDYTLGNGDYLWKEEGTGFEKGDVVNMRVYLEQGNIKWIVNGRETASVHSPFLKKKNNFVAYVELRNTGDTVQIWN